MARDAEGKVYTVPYEAVNAILLNEFLKEHRKVEELEATAAHQQKQIKAHCGPAEGERTARTEQARTTNGGKQSVKLLRSKLPQLPGR